MTCIPSKLRCKHNFDQIEKKTNNKAHFTVQNPHQAMYVVREHLQPIQRTIDVDKTLVYLHHFVSVLLSIFRGDPSKQIHTHTRTLIISLRTYISLSFILVKVNYDEGEKTIIRF